MNTQHPTSISAREALGYIEWAIVSRDTAPGSHIYGLYELESTARRICSDLCKRYGEHHYYVAHIDA